MAILTATTTHAQLPDQGISTTSPIFNDKDGRTVQIYQEYTDTKTGVRYYGTYTATSLGNSLWLSSAHCFDSKDMGVQEKKERLESSTVMIGQLGTNNIKVSKISNLEFAPDSQSYVPSGDSWIPKNDLVLFKTEHDIASGGFDVWTDDTTPPAGAKVTATGTGGKDFVTTVTFPSGATYRNSTLNNEVVVSQVSRVGICSGDSGGAVVLNGNNLIGINAADNAPAINPSCNKGSPRYITNLYVPLVTDTNKNFIRNMKDKYTSKAHPPASGSFALSS